MKRCYEHCFCKKVDVTSLHHEPRKYRQCCKCTIVWPEEHIQKNQLKHPKSKEDGFFFKITKKFKGFIYRKRW